MTPGPQGGVAQLQLASDPTSARDARRFVAEVLEAWSCSDQIDDAALLASELVTNAVIHGRPTFKLAVHRRGSVIRVEVADGSPAPPQRRHYSATAGTGRGLALVDELSLSWGVETDTAGKVVWFELRVGPAADHDPRRAGTRAYGEGSGDDTLDLDALAAKFGEPVDEQDGPSARSRLVAAT